MITQTIQLVYQNGVFRPLEPVDLPEDARVEAELRPIFSPGETGLEEIYAVLSRRHRSGHADTAERHNEHLP